MADPDYFTLTEFRLLPDMGSTERYPEARVLQAAAYITAVIEREVGTSFIPRNVTETLDGSGGDGLVLGNAYVRSITTASLGGTSLDVAYLSVEGGVMRRATGTTMAVYPWNQGYSNVVVTYVAGYSATPPADVKEAAMQGTRSYLLEHSSSSSVMDRRSSVSGGDGGTTSFVLAGPDRPTGYPEVDAVILGWKARLDVSGFA